MALEESLKKFGSSLDNLREAFTGVRIRVAEDRPRNERALITDGLEDIVEAVWGSLQDADKHGMAARIALDREPRLHEVRRSLAKCQQAFRTATHRYFSELISYARLAELKEFGRERGSAWEAWVETVMSGLEKCRVPLDEANAALDSCWEDLAQLLGGPAAAEPRSDIAKAG